MPSIRPSRDDDVPDITAIYAHHVLHGTGTFETTPPTEADMVVLGLYNRGDYGTGHGWASAHSVAWAHDLADGIGIIQRPPTAQNYAIGGSGTFTGATPPARTIAR